MRSFILTLLGGLVCLLLVVQGDAQQSDFAVKKNFEDRFNTLKGRIDSAKELAPLDSLRPEIEALDTDFSPRSSFLDKALYPETFSGKMAALRNLHLMTYDRTYLLQTQGVRISELEAKILFLTARLDTLSVQRDLLFAELQETKNTTSVLRETIKQLTANLQIKDRLIFALVDTVFLPYGRDLSQVGDIQKEAISKKLERANAVNRIAEIASDNARFLEVTRLQGKDYANLIDQYQQFNGRWKGLREKLIAVAMAGQARLARRPAAAKGKTAKADFPKPVDSAAQIDSAIVGWDARLHASFWAGLAKEFTDKGTAVNPFTDGKSFSSSVRTYVDNLKKNDQDPSAFVNELWKGRIDREWREALSKESMLGKTEYAALDKLVSELSQGKVDQKFILYSLLVVVLVAAAWWFFVRKPKPKPAQPGQPEQP